MSTISHESKFFFLHIEKAAGSTIKKELLKYGPPGTIINFRDKKYIGTKFYGGDHNCRKYIEWFGEEVWDQYYSFAFVRNPWDRMVSWWTYLRKLNAIPNKWTLKEWLENYDFRDKMNQIDYLKDNNGKIRVNFVGRYENLQKDYEKIFKTLDFRFSEKLPHINKVVEKSHYSHFYDEETKQYVEKLFAEEIEYFKYKFENK